MKYSELLRLLLKNGWYTVSRKGSYIKLRHRENPNTIIFPDHGSREMGKGMEIKIKKIAGLKERGHK
ncbi:MAG: type II toxin-antitoxin system HicA family toxin [candidate division Zixibacteria bacterium]|nr:type II toxin-antitoxin system HicA family toxin [candidate division Zixibacteria bacterium]